MDTVSVSQLSSEAPNPIFIFRERHTGFRPPHRQDFFEICFVLGGSGVQITSMGEYPLSAGDVFLIPTSAWHGLVEADDLRMEFCCFSVGLLRGELAGLMEDLRIQNMLGIGQCHGGTIVTLHLSAEELAHCKAQMDAIFAAAGGDCFYGNASLLVHPQRISAFWRQIAHLTLLLTFLGDLYGATDLATLPLPSSAIRNVVAQIEAEPQYPWSLKELAAIAYLEPSYFLRRFRKEIGIPPLRYLFHVRMQRASELLISTRKPISQVAEETGIPQPSHFSIRFREYFRLSPAEYRRLFNGA